MTDEELDAIEARAAAATPGPWGVWSYPGRAERSGETCWRVTYAAGGLNKGATFTVCDVHGTESNDFDNNAFIAAAREDVPALVAEVRRLRGAFEPSLRATDHARRLRAMQLDIAHAWDLTDNDRAALKWALERIAELELELAKAAP